MIGISSNMRIFLCREPVDMRKSYDGLTNLVEHYFHENVLGGSFFLFINSQRNPTYEAKDLGLLHMKFERYTPDYSFFVTDNEQISHFNVVLDAATVNDTHVPEPAAEIGFFNKLRNVFFS